MLSIKDRFFHQETNKIGFGFLSFFFDFLPAETLIHIYRRTLILFSRNYTEVPGLRKSPWKERGRRNVVPGCTGRRGNPKSGELVAGMDRGRG
jgi:hypothetical protein